MSFLSMPMGMQFKGYTPPDISQASYDSVSVSVGGGSNPQGFAFKPDGTKMFVIADNEDVYQYSLSTAWDLSTASLDGNADFSGQGTSHKDIAFRDDGAKMYLLNTNPGVDSTVYQYSLSTPWSVSSASYDSVSFGAGSQDTAMLGFAFKLDGTKMYLLGTLSDSVHQYSLSTPWDLSSASYDNVSHDISGQFSSVGGVTFSEDGVKMYATGLDNANAYQYSLSTPWDLSSASYDSVSHSVSTEDDTPRGIRFSTDGEKMFILGDQNNNAYQYSVAA